jgi:hypothetical protein
MIASISSPSVGNFVGDDPSWSPWKTKTKQEVFHDKHFPVFDHIFWGQKEIHASSDGG